MSADTKIEWAHPPGFRGATWNPTRGCRKISPGCKHCYAETFAERWRGTPGHAYEQGFDPRTAPGKLDLPLRTKAPTAWFVNSMSDLFLEDFTDEYIAAVFGVMAASPRHRFLVLTKRAERMRRWFEWVARLGLGLDGKAPERGRKMFGNVESPWPLPNVWLGVSVESQAHLIRIDDLRRTPAAKRFVSLEPLLEDPGVMDLHGIDWLIVGGESGPGARPFDVAWARSAIEQCRAAGVPVFVKQLGARPILCAACRNSGLDSSGANWCQSCGGEAADEIAEFRNRKGADPSEWPEDLRVREWPP